MKIEITDITSAFVLLERSLEFVNRMIILYRSQVITDEQIKQIEAAKAAADKRFESNLAGGGSDNQQESGS
jgi:hypothetical protein